MSHKQSKKPIALVDMDGTLVDFNGQLSTDLDKMSSPGEDRSINTAFGCESYPHIAARAAAIKRTPNWWFNLGPLADGFAVVAELERLNYKIVVLTRGPKNNSGAWEQKARWIEKYLPGKQYIITGAQKSMVQGSVLVDDWIEYMESWLETNPNGVGLMANRPWNLDFNHPRLVRYHPDMETAFQALAKHRA